MDNANEVILFLTKNWMLSAGLMGLVVALFINEIRHFSSLKSYSPQEIVNKMNHEQAKLIDCREVDAFKAGHILGAVNIPKLKFEESQSILAKFKGKQIILVCHQGMDSPKIGKKLLKRGFENVIMLEGGIQAWKKEGLPVERG
jgi:rhodanese-related sulfurtransferase